MKRFILLLIVFVSIQFVSLDNHAIAADFKNVGHSGANFLQIPVDAAGASMGNSFVAMASGVNGLYWNPAAIKFTNGTEIMLSVADWILDTKISHLGITHSFDRLGSLGLSISSFTMDEMEITTEFQPNGTDQYFDAGNFAVGISYALSFTDQFTFGISAKYVNEYIWEAQSSGIAFDLGSIYRTNFYGMRIGMAISNFGGNLKMSGDPIDDKITAEQALGEPNNPRLQRLAETYSLPQQFEVGVAFEPYIIEGQHRVTIAFSANDPNDNQTRLNFGGEYAYREILFVRTGYKSGYDEQKYSLGLGTKFEFGGITAQLDYAFVDFGILDNIHYLTFRTGF